MKIATIHATQNAIAPLELAFKELDPLVKVYSFLNENLLMRANEVGGVDPVGLRSFLRLAMDAIETKPDGIVIACSLYCPYVDLVQKLCDCPVIAIDAPMISRAVKASTHVGVLATTAASGSSAEKKLNAEAEKQGKQIQISIGISTEAMSSLKSGDVNRHNSLLREKASELIAQGCDSILLSQITMACAKPAIEELGIPVLSSPQIGAKTIIELAGRRKS